MNDTKLNDLIQVLAGNFLNLGLMVLFVSQQTVAGIVLVLVSWACAYLSAALDEWCNVAGGDEYDAAEEAALEVAAIAYRILAVICVLSSVCAFFGALVLVSRL